jgi:hypothetical protein
MEVFDLFVEIWVILISIAIGIVFFSRIAALAFWESQIERDGPWAKFLNVWRVWTKIPKEVTAYHLGLAADTVTAAISNDIITVSFLLLCGLITDILSISQIIMLFVAYLLIKISMIILQFVFEDYLWHILNPRQDEYGFHTFANKKYPAFLGRVWIIPREYIVFILTSGIPVSIAGWLMADFRESHSILWMAIAGWLIIVSVLLILTAIITIKAPALHKAAAKIKSWVEKYLKVEHGD